jgi:glycolate oxidase FAD binding subunit
VKNVAGLDMAKLMAGSFGTLAAIAVVNFKVVPALPASRTFALSFDSAGDAIAARNRILNGVLQPTAIDALNPAAAARVGLAGFALLIQGAGNQAVLDRYSREMGSAYIEGPDETRLWRAIREFTPEFLREHVDGAVVRISSVSSQTGSILESMESPAVARAGSGVTYGYFAEAERAAEWMRKTATCGWKPLIEFAPAAKKPALDLWPNPGGDLELMRRVKRLFDPGGVLNAGRLYGRI